MRVGSESWHRKKLNFSNINSVLFEFCEDNTHCIFDPKSFSFDFFSGEELLIVCDSVLDFSSRICSLSLYRVDHIMGTFVTNSHDS